MGGASGKSLYKIKQFSRCSPCCLLPFFLPAGTTFLLELRQPACDYEVTTTQAKDSTVEILVSDGAPAQGCLLPNVSLQEKIKHPNVLITIA